MNKFDSSLYFITDSTGLCEEKFLSIIKEALKGGVTLVQLREKEKSTTEYIDLARKVHSLTKEYNVPLIIDDRADVAVAIGAEGVHVGANDISPRLARKILGADKIVGVTAKTVEQALDAYNSGADYLGVGAIYPTTTKVKTVITPLNTLSDICKSVPIPVNAIGGLNKDNIHVLKGTGIAGICVVSAIMRSDDPLKTVAELKKAAEIVLS